MASILRSASKEVRLATRSSFIPKDARCILEHTNGSALYAYETGGILYAMAFWGTAAKPFLHYRYRTEDARNLAIQNFKASIEQTVARRQKAQADKKAQPNTLKAGDILHTSWGYDQTNVDFYAVTRVSGKRVYARRIAADYEATGHMSGRAWPAMPIRFTGEETMHTSHGSSLTIDGHHASLETGRDHYTSSYA